LLVAESGIIAPTGEEGRCPPGDHGTIADTAWQ
jgi:hypothetical protein